MKVSVIWYSYTVRTWEMFYTIPQKIWSSDYWGCWISFFDLTVGITWPRGGEEYSCWIKMSFYWINSEAKTHTIESSGILKTSRFTVAKVFCGLQPTFSDSWSVICSWQIIDFLRKKDCKGAKEEYNVNVSDISKPSPFKLTTAWCNHNSSHWWEQYPSDEWALPLLGISYVYLQ